MNVTVEVNVGQHVTLSHSARRPASRLFVTKSDNYVSCVEGGRLLSCNKQRDNLDGQSQKGIEIFWPKIGGD